MMTEKSMLPLRINCGGESPVEIAGHRWLADDGRSWERIGGNGCTREAELPLFPASHADLLRCECYGLDAYRFPLPAGRYDITLLLAETHEGLGTAERRYSLHIDGQLIDEAVNPNGIAGGHARAGELCIDAFPHQGETLTVRFGKDANIYGLMVAASESADMQIRRRALQNAPVPTIPPPRRDGCQAIDCFFIGHSGFFFHAVPESLAAMIAAARDDVDLLIDGAFHGGKGISFLNQVETVAAGLSRPHDLVMVTDGSVSAVEKQEEFLSEMPIMIERIRACGARPLLYAYQGSTRYSAEQRAGVMQRYLQVGREHDATVIPCAATYNRCKERHPDWNLNNPDGHHLGLLGGWLFTCCCYRALTGSSAVGHPAPFMMAGQVRVPEAKADMLAAIADEVCDELGCGQRDLLADIQGVGA